MVILPVWILLVPMVYGMFHELSMEYFNSSLPKDSLFGYSIAYLPSRKSILVGAPNANYIGNVFNINVISKKIEEIPIDIESETFPNLAHGVWLGATVKAAKDTFVSCAPRRLWHKGYCTGECIISKDDIYTPGIKSSKIKFLNSFGSSLEVVSGKKGIEILVGDPSFSSNWLSRYTHPFVEPQLIELEKFRPDLQKIYNFGYNVATGNFFSNHDYVISTTYGTVGLGMVFIFNSNLINVETIEDNAVGSMFGASLCRVHLDDGRASLLVGAPTFSETHSFDVGAVYLYKVNTNTGSKMTLVRKITGTTNGGYFGYAITNLGDIDGDKLDDIAIGAPYEGDGRGSVYIYTGAGLVNHKGPRQVIKAKDIWNLGFSFTTIKDDDASGCNGISNSCSVVRSCCTCANLAVGAPNINAVVLFRCITSITIVVRATFQNSNLKNKTHVELESCLNVTYPDKPVKIVGDIIMSIESPYGDYTIADADDGIQKHTLSLIERNTPKCTTFKLALTANIITKQPILAYKISANLSELPANMREFDSSRVILSERSVITAEGEHIISNCGDRLCVPILQTEFTSSMPTGSYVIGSSDSEWISLAVKNYGETAYAACVTFDISGVHVLQLSSTCTLMEPNLETIICKPLRPLFENDTWNIDKVKVETKDLTCMNEKITIKYNVYNHCRNESDKTTELENIELISDYKSIMLIGESLPDVVTLYLSNYEKEITVQHSYNIINTGPTNWVNVKSIINIQNVFTIGHISIDVVSDKNTNCPVSVPSNNVTCNIGDLRRGQKIIVSVTFKIIPKDLGLSEKSNATVTTGLTLLLKKEKIISRISTICMIRDSKVPLWIIIVAILIGFILLLVTGFTLYKCGFLKRQHKVLNRDLQESVNQQNKMERRASCSKKFEET